MLCPYSRKYVGANMSLDLLEKIHELNRAGESFAVATVVRVESDTLASRVGRRPRDCGVALALDAESVVPVASEVRIARPRLAAAAVA